MFKWPGEQEKTETLKARPTADELKKFMVTAARRKDCIFQYQWKDRERKKDFQLTLKYVPQAFSFEWTFSVEVKGKQVKLWADHSEEATAVERAINEAADQEPEVDSLSGTGTFHKNLSATKRAEAKRILEQTFDFVSAEELQELSLMPESLTGNLAVLHITTLLQSIAMGQMSGRLRIQRQAAYADIFFVDGKPTHAEGSRAFGEECFIQVICWKEGEFHFEPKLKTDQSTIRRAMDTLILEGVLLLDNTEYLKNFGAQMQTVLLRTNPALTESQFESIVAPAEPPDMGLCKAVYLQVDGRKTIQDIVDILHLERSQWVPSLALLMRTKVADMNNDGKAKPLRVAPKKVDRSLLEPVVKGLTVPETGLYSYPAFLFLIDHELKFSAERPLSILLFGIRPAPTAPANTVLEPSGYVELARCIAGIQGVRGIITHYEQTDMVLTLMGANSTQGATVADRIIKSMLGSTMELRMASFNVAIGIATFPDDAEDLPTLLAAAEKARDAAFHRGGHGMLMARDVGELDASPRK